MKSSEQIFKETLAKYCVSYNEFMASPKDLVKKDTWQIIWNDLIGIIKSRNATKESAR